MQFFKGALGFILFCSLMLTVMQYFPLFEENIQGDNIELSQKSGETDSDNSIEEDVDNVDDFLPLSDFNFSNLISIPFIHSEFSANYFYLITAISSPPPKI